MEEKYVVFKSATLACTYFDRGGKLGTAGIAKCYFDVSKKIVGYNCDRWECFYDTLALIIPLRVKFFLSTGKEYVSARTNKGK